MSNLNIINNGFNEQVESFFKEIFKHNLTKKRYLTYSEVIEYTSEEFGITEENLSKNIELKDWYENIKDLKYLKEFSLSSFEEIIIHSPTLVQIHNQGEVRNERLELSTDDIYLSIQVLAMITCHDRNHSNPFISFNMLLHGIPCRLTTLHPAVHGNKKTFKVFIRKIGNSIFSVDKFTNNRPLGLKLKKFVEEKSNILITGATGSGKTAFISSLLSLVKLKEHVIVLEDTQEISICRDNFTYLLSDIDECYSLENYTQYSMRMRPDRMIVGELRGSEIIPFMLAMNNGHKGLISSIHANCARDGLERAALLFEMNIKDKSLSYSEVLKLISRNIDYVIHISDKKVTELIKVIGANGERVSYEFVYSENKYECKE